jgi:alpha-ribazole phosphatase
MAELFLVRHSKTAGNTLGRYIGSRTDESLCQEGIDLLTGRKYPEVSAVFASPMKRCVETAELIWPEFSGQIHLEPELRECDFGDFENKNYRELNGDPDYQAWIDSGGTLPFPHGESTDGFKQRCQLAFAKLVDKVKAMEAQQMPGSTEPFRAACVVHGGTIMAILEKYGSPKRDYFDYQVKNGCGYLLTSVEGTELWNCQYWP